MNADFKMLHTAPPHDPPHTCDNLMMAMIDI